MADHTVEMEAGDADQDDSELVPPPSAQKSDEEYHGNSLFVSQDEDNDSSLFVPQEKEIEEDLEEGPGPVPQGEDNQEESQKGSRLFEEEFQDVSHLVDELSRKLPAPSVPIYKTKHWSAPKDPRMLNSQETMNFKNLTTVAALLTRLIDMQANHFDEFVKFKLEMRRHLGSIAGSSAAGSRRNSTASVATRRSSTGQDQGEEDDDDIVLSPGQKQKDLAIRIITNYNDFLRARFAAFMTGDEEERPIYVIKNPGTKKYSMMFFTALKEDSLDNYNEDEAKTLGELQSLLQTASKDTYAELYIQLAKHWKAQQPQPAKGVKGKKQKTVQTLSASQHTIRNSDNSSSQPGPSVEHLVVSDSPPPRPRRAAKRARYTDLLDSEADE